MRLSSLSLLFAVLSFLTIPIVVLINYALFGASSLDLEVMHLNFLFGLVVYVMFVLASMGLTLLSIVAGSRPITSEPRALVSIVVVVLSMIVYGPSLFSSLSEIREIGDLLAVP